MLESSYSFNKFIRDRIEADAYDAIDRVSPTVSLEELYDGFNVDPNTKQQLLKMSNDDWFRHYRTYELHLIGFDIKSPVPVDIRASLPKGYEVLTARSVFAPVFVFAQEWSILYYAVSNILPLITRSSIANVFPWMRDLIREEEYDFDKDARNRMFFAKYNIKTAYDKRGCVASINAIMRPSKIMPILPNSLRRAAALGGKLYTQYRLLKQRPPRRVEDKYKIAPQMHDSFVPQHYRDAIEEMRQYQRELKEQALHPKYTFGEDE